MQILGQSIFTFTVNAPGLVLKEFGKGAAGNGAKGPRGKGDYAVVFTGALPVPAPILRGLARYGGCNVWCDDDVVISADERMVSLHATEKGPFLLHFPRTVKTVTDAITGQVVARNVAQLALRWIRRKRRCISWIRDSGYGIRDSGFGNCQQKV